MNLLYRFLGIILFFSINIFEANGQQVSKTSHPGMVQGIIRDSTHNHVLGLASVAIYSVQDSTLLSYQLTNSFGEFQFSGVVVDVPLKAMVTYIGYTTVSKRFIIPKNTNEVNLGIINLERSVTNLREVTINYVPPVSMNGDTLEFNAAAFDLDKNAVAEDLIRRLPRVTLWGDGTITVNGKTVKQLLVNGKPFFGGDMRVAIQNIPKDVINKVQIYKEQQNKRNLMDSITSMNIKLKKDLQNALFGKLSLGFGTNKSYESDANLNILLKKTQLSIVGAKNNTNKFAENANTLLKNNTFKGVGPSIDYQSDFRLAGTNTSKAAGFVFQHDFLPSSSANNVSRLSNDYFVKNISTFISDKILKVNTLGNDSIQTQQQTSSDKTVSTNHKLQANYERQRRNFKLNTSAQFNKVNDNTLLVSEASSFSQNGTLQSSNRLDVENEAVSNGAQFQLRMAKEKDISITNRLPGNWEIEYVLDTRNNIINRATKSYFLSKSYPETNNEIDRLQTKSENKFENQISFALADFSRLIFGNRGLFGISFQLRNSLNLFSSSEKNNVKSREINAAYQIDPYLTNANDLNTRDNRTTMQLRKTFLKDFVNRYQKLLIFEISVQNQNFNQKNNSSHIFQNISKNYQNFLPGASVSYTNDQYGEFTDNYTLGFFTQSKYPTIYQLSPLVDSINIYDVQHGNIFLKDAMEHKLSLSIDHSSHRSKNKFSYNGEISLGLIDKNFADSSIIDKIGRTHHYPVNLSGNRYAYISAFINKAFSFGKNQLQIQSAHQFRLNRSPGYINSIHQVFQTRSMDNSINLYYLIGECFAINLKETFSIYHSSQIGLDNNSFRSSMNSAMLSTSLNLTPRICIGSNISVNYTTSTGARPVNFNIWNANATYRLLTGNNLELKLTALDILNQNISVINSGINNSITQSTTNALKQYVMFSLAYYPRKFGRKREVAKKDIENR